MRSLHCNINLHEIKNFNIISQNYPFKLVFPIIMKLFLKTFWNYIKLLLVIHCSNVSLCPGIGNHFPEQWNAFRLSLFKIKLPIKCLIYASWKIKKWKKMFVRTQKTNSIHEACSHEKHRFFRMKNKYSMSLSNRQYLSFCLKRNFNTLESVQWRNAMVVPGGLIYSFQ